MINIQRVKHFNYEQKLCSLQEDELFKVIFSRPLLFFLCLLSSSISICFSLGGVCVLFLKALDLQYTHPTYCGRTNLILFFIDLPPPVLFLTKILQFPPLPRT